VAAQPPPISPLQRGAQRVVAVLAVVLALFVLGIYATVFGPPWNPAARSGAVDVERELDTPCRYQNEARCSAVAEVLLLCRDGRWSRPAPTETCRCVRAGARTFADCVAR
jgi:hypothetical protein